MPPAYPRIVDHLRWYDELEEGREPSEVKGNRFNEEQIVRVLKKIVSKKG